VAKGLKDVFMMLRLRLVNDDWDGERDTAMWPFPRNNKDQSKIHTTRFFKTTQNIEGVTPLDRMIASMEPVGTWHLTLCRHYQCNDKETQKG
jgi:hypothetical protein